MQFAKSVLASYEPHRRLLRKSSFAILALIFVAARLCAQQNDSALDKQELTKIPVRMQEFVDAGQLAGVVTLVERNGKIVETSAVGMQNIEEKRAMRVDSIFQIMSMTKPLTAVGIMMLVEDGKISLYDNVEKYLPEFRDQKVNVDGWMRKPDRPIKIYDLLTHTSGMRGMPQGPMKDIHHTLDHTLAEAVTSFAKEPLEFQPGTHWLYSNLGIATLGRIIEVVSGQPYESFIEARLLKPLQMKDSFFFPPEDKLGRIAIAYAKVDGKLVPAPADSLGGAPGNFRKGSKYPGPEFGLFSTAEDLSHFYQMVLDKGTWHSIRFLSPASIDTMTEVQTAGLKAGWHPGSDYGLAWEIISSPLGTLNLLPIGSFGHGGAFGTHGWVIPKRNMVTVFMVSCTTGDCADTPEDIFEQLVAASIP